MLDRNIRGSTPCTRTEVFLDFLEFLSRESSKCKRLNVLISVVTGVLSARACGKPNDKTTTTTTKTIKDFWRLYIIVD